MKIGNILVDGQVHLAVFRPDGVFDATAAGFPRTALQLMREGRLEELRAFQAGRAAHYPSAEGLRYANVVDPPGKILCIGLNYRAHADNCGETVPESPTVFSKFPDSLCPHGEEVPLLPGEDSFDYEAELVIVMGRCLFQASPQEAEGAIFGYTCGNDLSCRAAQTRTSQWLMGKAWPSSGPCGPWIVTGDEFDPGAEHAVRCRVNGQQRQDGRTTQMIFSCRELVSAISHCIPLSPGDLIFTGTPSGVIFESRPEDRRWLRPGDTVEVEIEGIGVLRNTLR